MSRPVPRPKRGAGRAAGEPHRPTGRREQALHWRARLECERGTPRIIPPADCQVALVYPNTYGVGMASLGYQMVYRWINEQPGALAERFFCEGRPALSVENQRPLDQFDLVAFSFSYELDLLAVVRFLMENHVAVRAADRDPRAEPIVLAGGVSLLVNRLPIYDLADVLVLGDGEEIVARVIAQWSECGKEPGRFLRAIASIPGVEITAGAQRRFRIEVDSVPRSETEASPPCALSCRSANASTQTAKSEIEDPTSKIENRKSKIENPASVFPHFVPRLEAADASSAIITPFGEFGACCLVEIARGCPYRCGFCFIGDALPYRARPFEAIREMIERAREHTGRFGLIAPAVGSHPAIGQICAYCRERELELSFSSLRLEDVTPAMLDALVASRQQSVTIAPEAGSERLRKFLGKSITDAQVRDFAADAAARGLRDLRLYFMIGLPTEEDEDIEAIARLVELAGHAARKANPEPRSRVTVSGSLSIFVPKPGTPLAERERPPVRQLKSRLRRLSTLFGRMAGVDFRLPSIVEAEAQRMLSWGGRELLPVLIETAGGGGTWREFVTRASRIPR